MSNGRNFPLLRMRRQDRNPWLSPITLLPTTFVPLLLLAAAVPGLLAPIAPDAVDFLAPFQPPGAAHWFGTDQLGRDVFSRVVHGTAQSLFIGLGATLIACAGGVVLGTITALAPRPLDRVLVRLLDILLAFPEILLALLVIAVLGREPFNTSLAVGLAGIAGYARLVRAEVLRVSQSGYVEQAVVIGEPYLAIVAEHIVPNTIRPLAVLATVGIGTSLLAASALSFLGLGVVPPSPEWGALLADGRNVLDVAPWVSLLPATVVALSVISMTLLGRRLQAILLQKER
ncbi:dipeptide/oligopeptide ABC transporter permease protein (plasmid) [Rhizobium gallicum]|uniref:Dipeptide/oligopeptide ABC transporter permease protein n=1 Tax=Rhizobium gallicum TaxID=56730 RepID=A0A1L5NRC4_9HYPH|nr:ABC transporter permease [Rhizobium gallicum]APO70451.1 dipeptide/oligopeptide ABC transporter permease protein [Rhizobium gallicum]